MTDDKTLLIISNNLVLLSIEERNEKVTDNETRRPVTGWEFPVRELARKKFLRNSTSSPWRISLGRLEGLGRRPEAFRNISTSNYVTR